MAVTVRTGAAMRSLLGGEQEVLAEGSTVGQVLRSLEILERLCDGEGSVRRHFNIHVNDGEDTRLLNGLDTPVADGDTVTILSAIAGGEDVVRKVWLTFPRDLVDKPLIWEAGRKFDVVTNIRQASVTREIGLVGLALRGPEDEVTQAIDFFRDAGVQVEPVELDVVE